MRRIAPRRDFPALFCDARCQNGPANVARPARPESLDQGSSPNACRGNQASVCAWANDEICHRRPPCGARGAPEICRSMRRFNSPLLVETADRADSNRLLAAIQVFPIGELEARFKRERQPVESLCARLVSSCAHLDDHADRGGRANLASSRTVASAGLIVRPACAACSVALTVSFLTRLIQLVSFRSTSRPLRYGSRCSAPNSTGQLRFVMIGNARRWTRRQASQQVIDDWVRTHGKPVDPALWRADTEPAREAPGASAYSAVRRDPPELYDLRG